MKEKRDMNLFLAEVAKSYTDISKLKKKLISLETIELSTDECIFLMDLSSSKITFHKGFDNLLGFSDDEVTLDYYLEQFHPEDKALVNKVGKFSILHSINNPENSENNVLHISFRIRKKNETFIKVLCQSSIYEVTREGVMISSLVKVRDISFLDDSDIVQWKFEAANLNLELFRNQIYNDNNQLFTPREIEIIQAITKNHSNSFISEELKISKHTVATHRKNIMRKSNCHDAIELVLFCKKNGII